MALYRRLVSSTWQVHVIFAPSPPCVIISDRHKIMRVPMWTGSHAGGGISHNLVTDSDSVKRSQASFDSLWDNTEPLDVLYEARPSLLSPSAVPAVVIATGDVHKRLLRELQVNPTLLHSLDPFAFEHLVAELLQRQGSRTYVTPKTKDGGFDILARHMTPLGEMMYVVECKRWSPENPVGIEIVNALYGVVERERATGGMIVTTSRFTRGALETARTLENRISLADYEKLQDWLRGDDSPAQ